MRDMLDKNFSFSFESTLGSTRASKTQFTGSNPECESNYLVSKKSETN